MSTMHVSPVIEDYLKTIYATTRSGEPASTAQLAARLKVTAASISSMLKRLDRDGLVEHARYRGVRLTSAGERIALHIIRRHRLLEQFLHQELDVPWERVHEEAEVLEHCVSDYLIEAIATKLGNPLVDPHGDPIPDRDLTVSQVETMPLAQLAAGTAGTFVRVDDTEPEMLRYLSDKQLAPGAELLVLEREPFGGSTILQVGEETVAIADGIAQAMHVRSE